MKLNRTPEKIGAGRIPKKQAGKAKANLVSKKMQKKARAWIHVNVFCKFASEKLGHQLKSCV